ncbi:hypothetical protein Tco_0516283 [Tanacetum coccineum]
MAWLPICDELRMSSNSVQWEPMFVIYCQRSVTEDYRLAREITRVSGEVNNVVIARAKDCETVDKLQILAREMELNARKKNLFIKKLNGLIPY